MAPKQENVSRADQVRARRKIEPVRRKPIPQTSQREARNAESASRVVVRRTAYANPAAQKKGYKENKRRVYVPTSTPGSEIRLPALPSIKIGWRIASAIIAVLAAAGIYMFTSSDYFEITTIELQGMQRVAAEEIAGKLPVIGESVIRVLPSEIETQVINAFPEIKTAIVKIDLPAQVLVSVEERIPAVTWKQNDVTPYWIDEDGFVFPIRGEATIPMVVEANAEPPRPLGFIDQAEVTSEKNSSESLTQKPVPAVDPSFVMAVLKLRNIVPSGTPLLYNGENGLGWTDPNGWQVYFGTDVENIDTKLAQYERIVDAILEKNLQPVLISLEYLHAPYYRLEH